MSANTSPVLTWSVRTSTRGTSQGTSKTTEDFPRSLFEPNRWHLLGRKVSIAVGTKCCNSLCARNEGEQVGAPSRTGDGSTTPSGWLHLRGPRRLWLLKGVSPHMHQHGDRAGPRQRATFPQGGYSCAQQGNVGGRAVCPRAGLADRRTGGRPQPEQFSAHRSALSRHSSCFRY